MSTFQSYFKRKGQRTGHSHTEPSDNAKASRQRAEALLDEGMLDEALTAFNTTLKELNQTVGPEHELSIAVQQDIAFLHLRRDDLPDAEQAFGRCFQMRKKRLGSSHPSTLDTATNLAKTYIGQEKWDEARALIQSALKAFEDEDGRDCYERFSAMSSLGDIYIQDGRLEDAYSLYQRALLGMETTVGSDDLATLSIKYSLATAHEMMREYVKAVEILKQIIVVMDAGLGTGHKDNLRARARLGEIYFKMGKLKDAEAELSRCLVEYKNPTSRKSKDAIHIGNELIALYSSIGRVDGVKAVETWMNEGNIQSPLLEASAANMRGLDTNTNPGNGGASNTQASMNEYSEAYNREIKIRDKNGGYRIAIALLDTQCHRGNWISMRLVNDLELGTQISKDSAAPELLSGTGESVKVLGAINLDWKWHPNGTRAHRGKFFVAENAPHLDVIFGVEYIVQENLMQVNDSSMIPLTEHKKFDMSDNAAIALAEEKQRQEKKALEARRAAAQQASQQSGTQSTSQTQQQN